MRTRLHSLFALVALLATAVSCNVVPQFGSAPIQKLVKAMTLEDKAAMVVVYESDMCTHAVPEMGIPSVPFAENPVSPSVSDRMLAQTWNTRLAAQTGKALVAAGHPNEYGCMPIFLISPEWSTANSVLAGRMTAAVTAAIRSAGAGVLLDYASCGSRAATSISSPDAILVEYDSTFNHAAELREDWGYQGLTVIGSSEILKASETIQAGYDLILHAGMSSVAEIVNAVEEGDLDEDVLDACVTRVLEFVALMAGHENMESAAAESDMAVGAAHESMVLLKNNAALPFSKSVRNIALYGPASYAVNLDGSVLAAGYKLDPSITSHYSRHKSEKVMQESMLRKPFQLRADAIENEMALVVIGRDEADARPVSDIEKQLINDVCEAFHSKNRKVTVILATPWPLETENWSSCPDAILQIAVCSQEFNQALIDVLSGKAFPSGRLTAPWPSYPFAYGLGYTSFTYSDDVCVSGNGRTSMSVKVTNSGDASGMETVRFYDGNTEPDNLIGFSKSRLLQPGESQIVELTVADSIPEAIVAPSDF